MGEGSRCRTRSRNRCQRALRRGACHGPLVYPWHDPWGVSRIGLAVWEPAGHCPSRQLGRLLLLAQDGQRLRPQREAFALGPGSPSRLDRPAKAAPGGAACSREDEGAGR